MDIFDIALHYDFHVHFLGFRYTTDGGSRETLEKGTIRGDAVFSGKAYTYNV